MDTSDKAGEGKGLLTTGATGKKKKNKKVSWAEESNLRVFHFFDLDETERGEIRNLIFVCEDVQENLFSILNFEIHKFTENVNRPKDFNQLKKQEAHMDRKVGVF